MPLLDWLRTGRRARKRADALYAAIVARARSTEFYRALAVPDTLDGRFDMIVLHMFVVLERLRGEGGPGRQLSQALFDLMFADMDRSLRELGVSDHAIGRRIKQMVSAFYGRMRAYDAAGADAVRLADALGRNVYRERPVDATILARLAAYVLDTRQELAGVPAERLLEGGLELTPPWPEAAQESR